MNKTGNYTQSQEWRKQWLNHVYCKGKDKRLIDCSFSRQFRGNLTDAYQFEKQRDCFMNIVLAAVSCEGKVAESCDLLESSGVMVAVSSVKKKCFCYHAFLKLSTKLECNKDKRQRPDHHLRLFPMLVTNTFMWSDTGFRVATANNSRNLNISPARFVS